MRISRVRPMRPEKLLRRANRALAEYEREHGITTAEMVARVESGALRAGDEIHNWLMTMHARDAIAAAMERSR